MGTTSRKPMYAMKNEHVAMFLTLRALPAAKTEKARRVVESALFRVEMSMWIEQEAV